MGEIRKQEGRPEDLKVVQNWRTTKKPLSVSKSTEKEMQ